MYRNVAYPRSWPKLTSRDTPTRRGAPWTGWFASGHVREHTAHGPQGGAHKVLTLTERGVERAERVAGEQGLDKAQKA